MGILKSLNIVNLHREMTMLKLKTVNAKPTKSLRISHFESQKLQYTTTEVG